MIIGERYYWVLCRKDNEDIKERESRRVAEMSEKLEKCKREADSFEVNL